MKIHIPDPCSEDWNEMTPTERGAFCKKCAIDVMDFTNKSPFEIRDILSESFKNKEHSCGRMQYGQMQAVNDIGFYWKNEQHRFQSVWVVSLMAVFGLTLFSCQNTVSKEIVAKMEVEAHEMLEDTTTLVLDSPVELSEELPKDLWPVLPEHPPYAEAGTILPEPYIFELDSLISICGPFVINGFISSTMGVIAAPSPDEENMQLWPDFANLSQPDHYAPSGESVSPWPHRNNVSKRSDLIYNTETDDFIAYITPAPITVESVLIIESFGDHEIYMSLENKKTQFMHTDKRIELNEGVHAFSMGFDKLPEGNYELELNSYRTNQILQFYWEGASVKNA